VTSPSLLHNLRLALDPTLLAKPLGLTLDPWQRKYLRTTARQRILLIHRQSGKSTCASIRATHKALYSPGSLTLLLSPSLRQSGELFRKVLASFRAAGKPVPAQAENQLSLELVNGSRVISLPGSEETIRGYSAVDLLVVDEASRVPDQLYLAVRPMLAVSQGELDIMSSPFGARGFFHKEWTEGEGWERFTATADQCPRISKAFLEQERRSMGDLWFRQEYFCEFLQASGAVFNAAEVNNVFTDGILPLFPDLSPPILSLPPLDDEDGGDAVELIEQLPPAIPPQPTLEEPPSARLALNEAITGGGFMSWERREQGTEWD
jgi:hypothetical protein